ncbi:Class I heat shock protein [Melia azedarach]|uniref:Class I heat shock protein n=1 Tax=Melia azedarach TaxID=155640 RepID=A0ACC1WZV8_MELAZ|nr:Class I heat shock protein [Melia azedarach]
MSHSSSGFFGPPRPCLFRPPNHFCSPKPWNDSYQHAQPQPPQSLTTIDWNETPVSHVYKADLPGFKKHDVKVEVEDGKVLCISGEKKMEKEEKTDNWCRVERTSGKFVRRFQIPENSRIDKMTARMDKEQLVVTIPKKEIPRKEPKNPLARVIPITG